MRIEAYLKQSPLVQASRMARRMEASLNLQLGAEGLTVFEALVLAAIFLEGRGEVRPSLLAETFETTRSNVSHCVSSLEGKGLVERGVNEEDARAMRLTLKPLGKRRAVRVVGILDGLQRRFEEEIGIARLQGLIAQMARAEEICRN